MRVGKRGSGKRQRAHSTLAPPKNQSRRADRRRNPGHRHVYQPHAEKMPWLQIARRGFPKRAWKKHQNPLQCKRCTSLMNPPLTDLALHSFLHVLAAQQPAHVGRGGGFSSAGAPHYQKRLCVRLARNFRQKNPALMLPEHGRVGGGRELRSFKEGFSVFPILDRFNTAALRVTAHREGHVSGLPVFVAVFARA